MRIARLLDLLVLGVDVLPAGGHIGGDFLGQRKRIVFVVEMIVVVAFHLLGSGRNRPFFRFVIGKTVLL